MSPLCAVTRTFPTASFSCFPQLTLLLVQVAHKYRTLQSGLPRSPSEHAAGRQWPPVWAPGASANARGRARRTLRERGTISRAAPALRCDARARRAHQRAAALLLRMMISIQGERRYMYLSLLQYKP
eukprot:6191459-Pleurochrysis_carterae.AAC.1